MDKSLATNLTALAIVIAGLLIQGPARELVLNTGLFALSGGVTNWLAVHMLFEKVPGFYGSGVIPARFEEFRQGIRRLVMQQFFSRENVGRFFARLEDEAEEGRDVLGLEEIIAHLDLDGAFESLLDVLVNSPLGGMLNMLGGREALEPLRRPFTERMRRFLLGLSEDREVLEKLRLAATTTLLGRVEDIVDRRIQELTPQLVKEIVQQMIKAHLGWLVVWGGVLGGLIGLLATLLLGY